MDISNTPSTTDDQELAKVLESMNEQADAAPVEEQPVADVPAADMTPPVQDDAVVPGDPALSLDEESSMPPYLNEVAEQPAAPEFNPVAPPAVEPAPEAPVMPEPAPVATPVGSASPELESIKRSALEELRPLVDKLDLPADERFDTLLLLIRSTDDRTLVGAAHDAAQQITDDTKRAQALLDVIKEIDYFSAQTPQA